MKESYRRSMLRVLRARLKKLGEKVITSRSNKWLQQQIDIVKQKIKDIEAK